MQREIMKHGKSNDTTYRSFLTLTRIFSLVQNLRSAVHLLHYLTFSSEPQPNIRDRLCYAPRGPFNGLVHQFIVAFGRLTFGDPPEYLDEICAQAIREIRSRYQAYP
jgi:hypothetical protein